MAFSGLKGETGISIHAPLAGCDLRSTFIAVSGRNFNPRTPCGVRRKCFACCLARCRFQSTHPLRGATRIRPPQWAVPQFQSTHPLRGATSWNTPQECHCLHFNPRTPCGVRPVNNGEISAAEAISIHAPLAGCDSGVRLVDISKLYFNPRTPCGVRRGVENLANLGAVFQSTHPLRGATCIMTERFAAA